MRYKNMEGNGNINVNASISFQKLQHPGASSPNNRQVSSLLTSNDLFKKEGKIVESVSSSEKENHEK